MSSQLKLSIDLNRGVSSTSENSQVVQQKDDQNDEKPSFTAVNHSPPPTDSAAPNSVSNPSDLSSANSATGGAKKKKKRDKTDGGTANGSAGGTNNGSTASRLNVPTSTGKAQKRRKIRTNFDAMAEKDDFFMEAQKLEMERLERLKKNRPSNDDHLQQFSALLSPHVQGPLPLLDVDAQDFDLEDIDGKPQSLFDIGKVKKQEMGEEEEEEEQMNIGSMPAVKKEEAAEPEIIDLSSDDDDIQEIGSFQRRPVFRINAHSQSTSSLPSLNNASYRSYGGRRTRWVGTEKEREDMLQIEKQHNQERERLRKQKRRTEDIEDIKCTTEGRLLVNSGHPEGESDIFVASHLTHILQPHQLGGIRFLWDNIITSLDEFKTSSGFGAILAHSMGLGKSIQVITFVEIFLRVTQAKKVLLIVPINVIQNWMAEFDKWLPIISSSGERLRQFQIFLIGDTVKTFDQRIDMIQTWAEKGGVLLIGYDMFRLLIRATQPKKPKPQRPRLRFMNGQSINKNTAQAQQQPPTATSSSDAQQITRKKQEEPDKEKEEDLRLEDGPDDGYTANGRVRKEANDIIRQNLLDPGPDLVVCDEGHKIKNLNSDISMALGSIKTRRRIVLTGYPLQNNLMEYYVMIDFVRPKYLGEKKSFSLMFEKPIKNGQCVDSTPSDIKLARQRTHILIEKLKGFVQRRTHNLLKKILPLNKEFVVLLRKSPVQKELYKKFLIYAGDELTQGNATFNPLKAFAACTKIWNHPDILAKTLQKRKEENDRGRRYDSDSNSTSMHGSEQSGCDADDLWDGIPDLDEFSHKSGGFQRDQGGTGRDNDDEATPMKQPGKRGKRGKTGRKAKTENGQSRRMHSTALNDEDEMSDDEELDKGLRYDWAEDVMTNYVKGRSENGYKLVLTMEIIDQSTIRGEKILVFSQNLTALDLMEEYLDKRRVQTADGDGEPWFRGRNYFRFDGSTSGSERERLINQFNSNPSLRLFLISTRAGSLGINLVSASRCVIFDACWNPVHDAQAVCRIYRYGQQKKTYIYRLILDNCMERAIFNRQISKHGLQQRVVDEAQVDTNITQKELEALLIYDDQLDQDDSRHDVENWDVEDDVLQAAVVKCNHMLSGMPFLHESLMMEREEGLSEEEKKEAELWFDLEQKKLSEGPELYDSLTIGNSDFKGGSSSSSSSTLGNVALNQFRQSSTLNGVSSWVMNARANPAMPSGLPPARPTPMPNVLQRNTARNYMVNGGGATMQSAKSSLSGGIGRMNMSQIAPQILNAPLSLQKPFPGASKASTIHHISNGTMQKIKLDRALLLPNANRSGRMVNVPVGAEVVLVKMNADIYISFLSLNGPELLDARGSVFDANTANSRLPPIIPPTRMARGFHSAPQSSMPSTSRLYNQTMPVQQPFAPQIATSNSEPDVIELD